MRVDNCVDMCRCTLHIARRTSHVARTMHIGTNVRTHARTHKHTDGPWTYARTNIRTCKHMHMNTRSTHAGQRMVLHVAPLHGLAVHCASNKLHAACDMLHVTCCMLHVTCCMFSATSWQPALSASDLIPLSAPVFYSHIYPRRHPEISIFVARQPKELSELFFDSSFRIGFDSKSRTVLNHKNSNAEQKN